MITIFNHSTSPVDALIKRCAKCGETKPHSAFSKDKNRRDGLQTHCKQCDAMYRSENADKERERNARWQQANPDKTRAKSQRRRATKRALPAQWSDSDAQRMLAYWGNRCAICEQKVEPNNAFYYLAADHWIALTSPECPGTVPCNILPLCHSKIGNAAGCNSAKSNADPIEWLNRLYPDDPKLVAKILARIAKYFKFIETDGGAL